MPRSTGGNYTLVAGNPVSPNTLISSTWANQTLNDIASALSESLSRDGNGAMRVPLLLKDGISGAPALSFEAEPTTGLYRVDDGIVGLSVLGTVYATVGDGEFLSPQPLHGQKGLTITNSTTNATALTATGNGTAAGGTFVGGSSNGPGLSVTGIGSGTGVVATGGTTGWGVNATGTVGVVATGTTVEGLNATGAAGWPGVKAVAGTAATGSTAQTSLVVEKGYLSFTGASGGAAVNPDSDVAFTNALTPKNVCKAWARIITGASDVLVDGFNIDSYAFSGSGDLEITFASAFTTAGGSPAYCPVAMSSTAEDIMNVQGLTTTVLTLRATNRTATINLQTAPARSIYVVIFGVQ
jgi:hypothetical protein